MLISLFLACNTGSGIEGVWALLVPPSVGESCQQTVTHNFLKGSLPTEVEEQSDWQTDSDEDASGSLVLVQIMGSSRKGATLVLGDRLYPGQRGEGGVWTFDWTGSETDTETRDHALGYAYTYDRVQDDSTAMTLSFDGDILTGTWEASSFDDREWGETDSWPDTITEVGETGSVPSGDYLVSVDDGSAVTNARGSAEWTTTECVLNVTVDCSESRELNGFRTGYRDDDAYDHLAGTGQPEGT